MKCNYNNAETETINLESNHKDYYSPREYISIQLLNGFKLNNEGTETWI